ncbi:hypothetical protein MLD38_011407 [Melastoma candidum]|uniref:Uncharacterized protein n=1 Tax=Melastoma candidum TaxID=119954 RepID=A0ACB9R3I4_9MYRT|nr:hypothetical protein MLD38_011407 [Melastoma candidum]
MPPCIELGLHTVHAIVRISVIGLVECVCFDYHRTAAYHCHPRLLLPKKECLQPAPCFHRTAVLCSNHRDDKGVCPYPLHHAENSSISCALGLWSLHCHHTSMNDSKLSAGSFSGLSFLAWYLPGKVRLFDRKGHVAELCI